MQDYSELPSETLPVFTVLILRQNEVREREREREPEKQWVIERPHPVQGQGSLKSKVVTSLHDVSIDHQGPKGAPPQDPTAISQPQEAEQLLDGNFRVNDEVRLALILRELYGGLMAGGAS